MLFSAAWEEFLADQKNRTGTANWKKHEYIGRLYLIPQIGNIKLSNVTPNMWRKCIDAGCKAGLSRRSLQNIKLSVSAFINFARHERWGIGLLEKGDLVIPQNTPLPERHILQPDALKKLFTIDTIMHWGRKEPSFLSTHGGLLS